MTAARRSWTAVLVVGWLVQATLTHLPADRLPPVHTSDKTAHYMAYLVLGLLLTRTLAAWGVAPRRRASLAAAILLAWGGLDEITQPLVNRHASVLDWLADAGGIATAVALDAAADLFRRLRRT